jgi:hypothetical protein
VGCLCGLWESVCGASFEVFCRVPVLGGRGCDLDGGIFGIGSPTRSDGVGGLYCWLGGVMLKFVYVVLLVL